MYGRRGGARGRVQAVCADLCLLLSLMTYLPAAGDRAVRVVGPAVDIPTSPTTGHPNALLLRSIVCPARPCRAPVRPVPPCRGARTSPAPCAARTLDVTLGKVSSSKPTVYTFEVFSRSSGDRWSVSKTYPEVLAWRSAMTDGLPKASAATSALLGLLPPAKLFFNDSAEVVQLRVARLTEFLYGATRNEEVQELTLLSAGGGGA
jgi:hypothetical protein